jgi:3-dehydroquinate dehydratase
MKILITLTNSPEGMNPSQLFEDKKHLKDWLKENDYKIIDLELDAYQKKVKQDKAQLTEKENEFKNY